MSFKPGPDVPADTTDPYACASVELPDSVPRLSRGSIPGRIRDFGKAYRKAREWQCSLLRSFLIASRYAIFGDSGRFQTHHGWRISRIYKSD